MSKENVVQCGKSDGLDQEKIGANNKMARGKKRNSLWVLFANLHYDHLETGVTIDKDFALRARANIDIDIVACISNDAIFTWINLITKVVLSSCKC